MDKYLESYIDNNIIKEYGRKTRDGYSLFIDELPSHDQENFFDLLMRKDEFLKDLVLDRMQELINIRLDEMSIDLNKSLGLTATQDRQTGEVIWLNLGGAA